MSKLQETKLRRLIRKEAKKILSEGKAPTVSQLKAFLIGSDSLSWKETFLPVLRRYLARYEDVSKIPVNAKDEILSGLWELKSMNG